MENFWSEISDLVKDTFEKAEDRSRSDLVFIKSLPTMLAYLKELEGDELLLWIDQAR